MKRTLLLVAAVIALILVPIFLFYGFSFLAIEALVESNPDLQDTVPVEYYGIIKTIGGILLVFALINIVASIRLLGARNDNVKPNEVIIWSILLIVSALIIPGVLGILSTTIENKAENSSLEMKLREIDSLYNQGLITIDEYNQKRKSLLEKVE